MSIGKSPDETVHCIVTESLKLDGSSSNSKGAILGGTKYTQNRTMDVNFNYSKRTDSLEQTIGLINQKKIKYRNI